MTFPEQTALTDCFRLLAASFASKPECLTPIVSMIAQEDRPEYLAAARAAGMLDSPNRQQLGLAAVPMLDSERPDSVVAALAWIDEAGCGSPELMTQALTTAKSHFRELIQLGAEPNLVLPRADHTPLGLRVLADDLAGFAEMVNAMTPAVPVVSRTKNLFDVAIEDMTEARAEMVDYILDRFHGDLPDLGRSLALAVVRHAVRRRHTSPANRFPRATLPTLLRMVLRAEDLTSHHATAWYALFNSDSFVVERTSLESLPGDRTESKFLRDVLDLAHPDQAVELLQKAACDGFSINHPCIQANGRSYPPLHYAAVQGHLELVRRLIIAGADPHAPDSRGATAFLIAKQAGHDLSVDELASLTNVRSIQGSLTADSSH